MCIVRSRYTDYAREGSSVTCPSSPPTSEFAMTCVTTDPSWKMPNWVAQSLLKLKCSHTRTANAGPSSGAARARNLPTWRAAWQRAQLLSPKVGLLAIDSTCANADSSSAPEDAFGGKMWGSCVLFYSERSQLGTSQSGRGALALGSVAGFVNSNG